MHWGERPKFKLDREGRGSGAPAEEIWIFPQRLGKAIV